MLEGFRTVIPEIEAVINRRLITYISESRDAPEPLQPVDFLPTSCPPPRADKCTNEQLNIRRKHRTAVLKSVWSTWRKEYLHELHRWTLEFGNTYPRVRDIVLPTRERGRRIGHSSTRQNY